MSNLTEALKLQITEIEGLKHDIERHVAICSEQQGEIERLRAIPEQLAKMIDGYNAGQIRLACGEMTAQEMRTVQAVQRWWVAAMRHKAEQLVDQQQAQPGKTNG
jgi:hypothetical protein